MLYAITDRRLYAEDETVARQRLLELAKVWASNGVAFIQLREKDLPARDQVELARTMLGIIRAVPGCTTRLLINGPPDIALAASADGVHLPAGSDALTPNEVRTLFAAAGSAKLPIITVSCHTMTEVEAARRESPDCILFAPVFEKRIVPEPGKAAGNSPARPGSGPELLAQACHLAAPIPIFALGGVTAQNAAQCLQAGATGIAAIRLFQQPPSAWLSLV
ncbi:MAG: thiamine phosphate synthase [Acidobacteriaceae bacterium]